MPDWIDAHCHLADLRIIAELPRILAEAERAGIGCFVQGGVDPEDWKRQAEIQARSGGRILTAYGLHPWWVAARAKPELTKEIEEGLATLAREIGGADALGELGLDFSPRFGPTTHETQIWTFERQLELGSSWPSKPLVLHVVQAHEPALGSLRSAARARALSGLVHSFSASRQIAEKYLDLGLNLSISGVITRKGFESLRSAVRYIPGDRLLVETDSPDQRPEGWEKPLNEPLALLRTAQAIAEILGERSEDVLERSAANLRRLFKKGPE